MRNIVIKNKHLANIEKNDAVIYGLQLLRILRTIRYHEIAYLFISSKKKRNLIHLQWFLISHLAAALYEGIKKVNNIMNAKRGLFSKFVGDKRTQEIMGQLDRPGSFIKDILAPIRNKIAYHYDDKVTINMIKKVADECIAHGNDLNIISGSTKRIKDMRFPGADQLETEYILMKIVGTNDREKIKNMSNQLLPLLRKFTLLLEEIIGDLISPCALVRNI